MDSTERICELCGLITDKNYFVSHDEFSGICRDCSNFYDDNYLKSFITARYSALYGWE